MRSPLATLLPLCSAFTYTFAALTLKRATERGVGAWRVTFIANWMVALGFLPWLLQGGEPYTLTTLAQATLSGCAFFVGQIFTFLAITRGDVSLTTPILGTKVLFVALLAPFFAHESLNPVLWGSAGLTCLATALLGGEFQTNSKRLIPSLLYGISAALAYATTDILQQCWAPNLGFGHFAPVMFATIGFLSLGLLPFFDEPLTALPAPAVSLAMGGGLLLTAQATGIAFSIAQFHEVTLTNILYATRGIWSVLVVWSVGHWFQNTEKSVGTTLMLRRLLGAAILLGAVLLSLLCK
ncbi:MAG: hypothetical protein RLZZ244_2827 [Verrucomicrobiota bacterium]